MKKISEIISTLFAYLKRPDLYPELRRKLWKNIFNRSSAKRGKEEAIDWCNNIAITEKEFVEKVLNLDFIPFQDLYQDDYKTALDSQNNASVKMGGPGSLEVIYYINEFTQSKNAVETGVAYGWSSFAALASISKRNGTLFSSDMPYIMQENSSQFVGCVIPKKHHDNWKLFRFADKESLPKIFSECDEFDFVHYDSDKTYDGRMWAYQLLWNKLKKGGIFMSDDIADNAAFKDFCENNNLKPYVIGFDDKFAGIVLK